MSGRKRFAPRRLTVLVLSALAPLSAFASTSAPQHSPRVWTSNDGRSIEARYLGRGADGTSLVLERSDTGARVTVPLLLLSPADVAHAGSLGNEPAPPAEQATPAPAKPARPELSAEARALIANWPQPVRPPVSYASDWDASHMDVRELVRVYSADLAAIGSGDPAYNLRTLRVRIDRDLARLAGLTSPASRMGAHWLRHQILPHLNRVEAALPALPPTGR